MQNWVQYLPNGASFMLLTEFYLGLKFAISVCCWNVMRAVPEIDRRAAGGTWSWRYWHCVWWNCRASLQSRRGSLIVIRTVCLCDHISNCFFCCKNRVLISHVLPKYGAVAYWDKYDGSSCKSPISTSLPLGGWSIATSMSVCLSVCLSACISQQVSKVIWQKGRIAVLSPVTAANAFVRHVYCAGTFATGGRQTVRNALLHVFIKMGCLVPPWRLLLPVGGIRTPM